MKLELNIQNPNKSKDIPKKKQFTDWMKAALANERDKAEVSLRIVDETESRHLNYNYRKKNKATNVLSFPVQSINGIDSDILGDIIMCAPVVKQEIKEDNKDETAHWAHLTVHGVLHLLGYDHVEESDAKEMEALETKILSELGFKDPYG